MEELPNLLRNYQQGDELEVRIGTFSGKTFFTGITEYIFYMLINYISNSNDYYKNRYIQKIQYFNGGYRFIKNLITNEENIIRKLNKNHIDFEHDTIGIRISLSSEENVTNILRSNITDKIMERDRIRTSLINKNGYFKLDLSFDTVKNIKGNRGRGDNRDNKGVNIYQEYQVELEFLQKLDISIINTTILWFIKLIDQMKAAQQIVVEYNNMIPEAKGKSVPYTGEKMPKNIKIDLIPFLEDYSVINKPNGINYIFYITSRGNSVLFNKTDLVNLKIKSNYFKTAIFGEFLNEKFYAIDTLLFNGKNIINKDYIYRWKLLFFLKKTLNWDEFNIIPVFSSPDLTENISNVFRYISKNWKRYENDGIIFKPTKLPFNNGFTYKWKPWDENTIDFSIKRLGKGRIGYSTYNLLVYISGKTQFMELIPFIGSKNYRINPVIEIDDSLMQKIGKGVLPPDLSIIEFNYIISSKKFIPKRIRHDKIKPNFRDVAESIWEDIFNPITDKLLINVSKINFNINDSVEIIINKACNYIKLTGDIKILEEIPVCKKDKIIDIFKEEIRKTISEGKRGEIIDKFKNYFSL